MAPPALVTRQGGALILSVRLTPKSSRDGVEGMETRDDGRPVLRARVRAVPEAGKANEALLRLLAGTLDLPVKSLSLATGSTGRIKTIRIDPAPAGLEDRIAQLAGIGT